MKRKIIQIANSTQLVSLPRAWALHHNLKRGDELEVEPQGNKLVITTDKIAESNEIELDVTGLDRTSIMYYMRSAYRCGYNTIRIKFDKPVCVHYRTGKKKNVAMVINKEVSRLVGMEVIQQRDNFCIIKAISEPSQEEFDLLLRRIFRIMLDTYEDLIKIAKEGDMVLAETIEEKHDLITKFVSCCLRILNQRGYKNPKAAHFVYHIIANVDNIVDIIKYSGRDLLEYGKKMSKDSLDILKRIENSLQTYYDFYYKFSFEKIQVLSENRDSVKFGIKDLLKKRVNPREVMILSNNVQILEMLIDLTESRASIRHAENE